MPTLSRVQSIPDSSDKRFPKPPLLEVKDLHLVYRRDGQSHTAVNGVSFSIDPGKTLALVGESGSGKSSIAKAIVKLIPVTKGEIKYQGQTISDLKPAAFFAYRKKIQLIFQDPWNSLNPRATIEDILLEPFRIHFPKMSAQEKRNAIQQLLDKVQLPTNSLSRFPHAFSGGQRQRIVIARALAVEPELLVCDEPVSALDVSIQAKILDLLMSLNTELNLSMLFISHDLAVVQQIASSVVVMKNGKIEENAPVERLFHHPQSPYTQTLIDACPKW